MQQGGGRRESAATTKAFVQYHRGTLMEAPQIRASGFFLQGHMSLSQCEGLKTQIKGEGGTPSHRVLHLWEV